MAWAMIIIIINPNNMDNDSLICSFMGKSFSEGIVLALGQSELRAMDIISYL